MRILICDDDDMIREQMTKYLHEYFDKHNLKCPDLALFDSGQNLLADCDDKDIVFLDIEMPGLSGINIGNELKKRNQNIIIFIITSYMEYLDEAMRFQVFRYLNKPIDKQRLFRNLKDALLLYHSCTVKIPVETKQRVYCISLNNIVCVEANNRKVIVHTISGDYESVRSMQYWTQKLTMKCFMQTHRSFIVNLEHITDFDHTLIHLYNHQFEAYLTRRKYSQFKEAYLLYLESVQ